MAEEYSRDLERAEEYEQLTARATAIGKNKMELSTGLIIAARYADKLRRVALVAFSRMVPKDIIIRDVSELNKELYEKIVNEMKLDKLDVIKIVVDAEYDDQNKKLVFSNLRIMRYYNEDKIRKMCKEYEDKIKSLENEVQNYKKKVGQIEELLKSME
ncbi:DUF2258 domain-containing protein [Stygiolobus caldivivus]|uniref:DUF2258 domain-containing protein n=1 Tax=Stygiolobus caldivivus TaxID=2824673 RepID=A0A8D5U8H8_9CREN|nr:single- stranded DNA-binding family protein [Stygiolobus caldivivus]BCU70868.1 hypothetical protein KN1_21650 [Stygiolobus caldivivus]